MSNYTIDITGVKVEMIDNGSATIAVKKMIEILEKELEIYNNDPDNDDCSRDSLTECLDIATAYTFFTGNHNPDYLIGKVGSLLSELDYSEGNISHDLCDIWLDDFRESVPYYLDMVHHRYGRHSTAPLINP